MKRCPVCGSFSSDNSEQCGVCGHSLAGVAISPSVASHAIPVGSELDAEILTIAQELCERLGIKSKHVPKSIVWKDRIYRQGKTLPFMPHYSTVPSDAPIDEWYGLTLAERARTRLEPKDWMPLLASSLIYHDKWQRKMFKHLFSRFFLPAFVILMSAILWLFYDASQIAAEFTTALLFAIAVTSVLSHPYIKKTKLQSDQAAAELVGKDAFLQALLKVESMEFDDVVKLEGQGFTYSFSSRPKLHVRISNMQSWTPGSTTLLGETPVP